MKEVTEWNGKPRWMWCWFDNENDKRKGYVVHILTKEEMMETDTSYPVMTTDCGFLHCAEIEEDKTRLNNYELSQLVKCFGVEFSYGSEVVNNNGMSYRNDEAYESVPESYKIRYKQDVWEEPTIETVWIWRVDETPDSDIARFISFMGWDKE